jgi:protein involved in polysaccharide export with SLBB domain
MPTTFLDRKRHAFLMLAVIFGGGLIGGAILAKLRPPPELARPPQPQTPPPNYSTTNPLALKPGEEIELTRSDPADPASERTRPVTIDSDGGLRLPILGPIMAAGLTPQQLEQAIAQAYRDRNLVQDAQVKVVRKNPLTTAPSTRPTK